MLRYRTGTVGGISLHCVNGWCCFSGHYPHGATTLSALLHGCIERRASTSHTRSIDETNNMRTNTPKWEPQLHRLAVVRPDLVDEWVPELNDADVSSVPCTSNLSVWWRCGACGKNYQASVRDRTVADKGCPCCSRSQPQPQSREIMNGSDDCGGGGAGGGEELSASPREHNKGGSPSLLETHPELASRWDYEKNGLLRPTDVTSTSELNVWWRPAVGRPAHERSFCRAVYAFVEMPYSMEEQREAQAGMELDTLQQVRRAAKIAEARELDKFPSVAGMLDDIFSNNSVCTAAVQCGQEPQGQELEGEDLHRAIELWERSVDMKKDSSYRPLFQFTETCDWAQVCREEVLTTYDDFVKLHRAQKQSTEGNNNNNNNKDAFSVVPSCITDPDWVQQFTLSVDDVSKGCLASSARLVLPNVVTPLGPQQSKEGLKTKEDAENNKTTATPAAAPVVSRRVDTLPPPPEEYENEVRTMFERPRRFYPRRPQTPPSREDDVTEGVPTMSAADQQHPHHTHLSSTNVRAEKDDRSSLGKNIPSMASFEIMNLSGAETLMHEYTTSISDSNIQFDADEGTLKRQTLLGPLAMQAMTEEEARALQYNRGAPRPRRTRRFRLRRPDDMDTPRRGGTALGTALGEGMYTSQGEEKGGGGQQQQQQIIEAPGAPRKVARPKRKRQENMDENNNNNNNNNTTATASTSSRVVNGEGEEAISSLGSA